MTTRARYSRFLVIGVLALSGAGAWISGELVKQHAGRWGSRGAGVGLFARVCEAAYGAGFDCAGGVNSPWNQIKIPIPLPSRDLTIGAYTVSMPVAFLGLSYFVFMGVWFAFIGRPREFGHRWHRIPLGVGLCGLAVSMFYVGVMALGSAPWCVWCLAVHGINLLLFLAIWRMGAAARRAYSTAAVAASEWAPERIARATLTSWEATRVISFSLIVITGLWAYRHEHLEYRNMLNNVMPYKRFVKSLQQDRAFLLREFHARPHHEIPLRSGEPAGSDQPQLTVFTDFECRACYCNSLTIKNQIAEKFQGRLNLQIRHYPLSNICNANVDKTNHANACEAAYAAEAARIQGGDKAFVRMCDLLFKNRKALGHKLYRDLAVQIGLDADRFQSEMNGEAVQRIVQSDIRLAEELGVTGTPTMLLNGRHLPRVCQVPVFWQALADQWTRSAPLRVDANSGSSNVFVASDAVSKQQP